MATVKYFDANGVEFDLNDGVNTFALVDQQGFNQTARTLVNDVVPLRPGVTVTNVQIRERTLKLPVLFKAATVAALAAKIGAYSNGLDSDVGEGTIRMSSPDGNTYNVGAYLRRGLEGNTSMQRRGKLWAHEPLTFMCPFPYWKPTTATPITFTDVEEIAFFGNPFFAFALNPTGVFGSQTVNNPGHVDAPVIWTIQGPFTSMVLTNAASGRTFTMNYVAGASEIITLNTDTGLVTNQAGSNLWEYVDTSSGLWPLLPGDNAVTVALIGDDATTAASLAFYPLYRSLYG